MEEPTNYRKTAIIGALGAAMFASTPETINAYHGEIIPLQTELNKVAEMVKEEAFCYGTAYPISPPEAGEISNIWMCNGGENGPIAQTFGETIYINYWHQNQVNASIYQHEGTHTLGCGWPQANYIKESATEFYAAERNPNFAFTPQYAQLNFWGQWVENHIGISPVKQEFDCENRITTFEFYEIMKQRIDELEVEEDIKIWLKNISTLGTQKMT